MRSEIIMMNSVLSRIATVFDWLGHLFIAFMFVVAIWKSQRIYSITAFRFSVILYALHIVTPPTVDAFWNIYNMTSSPTPSPSQNYYGAPSRQDDGQTMMQTMAIAGDTSRIMLALAVAIGLLSLIEPEYLRRGTARQTAAGDPTPRTILPPQQPHPLDRPVAVRPQTTTPQLDPLAPIPLASNQPVIQPRQMPIPPVRPAAPQPGPTPQQPPGNPPQA
jgi:hypothetical protein